MEKKTNIIIFLIVTILGAIPCFFFPDLDIRLLGIGHHRFFLFHSVIVPYLLLTIIWKIKNRLLGKIAILGLSSFTLGISIHLFTDIFQKKTINFFFVGTLIPGTYIDDLLWIIINMLLGFLLVIILFRKYFKTLKL